MDYLPLLHKALELVVKGALEDVEQNGLQDPSNLCISFYTKFPEVVIPKYLLEKYPDNMMIMLQHDFQDLHVYDLYFTISLLFGDIWETLEIPFDAIYKFEDPSANVILEVLDK